MLRLRCALLLGTTTAATAQDKITYQDHVRPVLENRCLNCHNADKKKGGLDLSTYGSTMAGGSGGVNLEPGDPGASTFLKVITHEAEPIMPPKGDKLPETEIDLVRKWIAGGLLETAGSTAKAKKKASFAMSAGGDSGKPDGPPAMPEHLLLEPVVTPPRPNAVTALAHSPWAPLAALGAEKQVLLYNTISGELAGVLPFPDGGFPESVTFTRNGALVLAAGGIPGKKGIVAVWDVKTGRRVIQLGEEFDSIAAADITPDYSRIALGTREKRVKIYDTASGQKLHEIKKHTDWVTAVAFSPDGVLLATGDRNGGVMVWETSTGGEFYNLRGHEKRIATLAWRGDSNLVASGSEDGTWIWWEMQNGTQVKKQGSHGGVLTLHFAPDGRMASGGRDGHTRIWDPAGNQVRDWAPGGGLTLATRFTHEGKTLLTGAQNGEIKIWDTAKDAPPLGNVIYNPPSLDARIAALQKDLADKQAAAETAKTAAAEKEAAMTAAKAAIEAAKKVIADSAAAAENMTKEAAAMKTDAGKLTEQRTAAAAALEEVKKQLAVPVPEVAPPGKAPGEVQAALDKAAEAERRAVALARTVLEGKAKTHTETITKAEAAAAEKMKTAAAREQESAAMRAKMDEMAKTMPDLEKKAAEAEKAAADAKPMIDAALAAVTAGQRAIQYWTAAKLNKDVLARRDTLATQREKLESLKTEIPTLEEELKQLAAAKTAATPPADEALTKIDKKTAETAARLEEAKKEQAAAAPLLPELEKAVETGWQSYLAALPKDAN